MTRYSCCPICGARYGESPSREELLLCASCGFHFWQNSKPGVGALIVDPANGHPRILLCRRALEPHKGEWDVPGGFLGNGEAPEEGLRREVREELNVGIRGPRLFSLGIDEYRRHDIAEEARFVLTLYYRCELEPGAVPVASDDAEQATWFSLSSVPRMAFASQTRVLGELREAWDSERTGVEPGPVRPGPSALRRRLP